MAQFFKLLQPIVAASFLVFVFAAWSFSAPGLSLADTCTGIAVGSGGSHPIVCGGDCGTTGEHNCKPRKGKDKDGEYSFCSCYDDYEQACCHLIVRGETADTTGVCLTSIGCAKVDALTCQLEDGQAICKTKPKGPITQSGN
ncbi:MAG: hypothetical protein KDC87_10350 [Planctomycetes bacterium]|nr:hypothetical protein [Planctomycetota bacterium]MCB9871155.1 hypothetical protein [Planctomycetota bacterium]